MRITLKLGTTLREQAPEGFVGGEGEVEVGPAATVTEVLDLLHLAPEDVNLAYLNHRLVSLEARLGEGDRLALFPPNFIHFHQFYLKRGN
jgi:molybdopterin converting factor small subunit